MIQTLSIFKSEQSSLGSSLSSISPQLDSEADRIADLLVRAMGLDIQ